MAMRTSPASTARPAFTLLEMILAAAVAVLLLAALYVAMDLQLRHAEAARDVVVETALARTLLNRITADITPSVGQADPARYQSSQSGSGGSMGGGASGAGAPASGSNSSGSGAAGSGASGTAGAASSSSAITTGSQTILVLTGDSSTLTLFVSRLPPDQNNANNLSPQAASDQRRIVYWLAGGGSSPLGLARQELLQVTSADAADAPPDVSDPNSKQIIAREVKSLQFEYFDGSEWQDSWDGTQAGSDGVTPIGPPLAVAITLGIARPDGEVKTYRHVVAIPTANNPTPSQPSSTGGSSSPSP